MRTPAPPRSLAATLPLTAFVFAAAVGVPASAAQFVVRPGESIQAALDRAADGDTIRVEPGTYAGDLDFLGKAVHVRGAGPDTVVRGTGTGPVVRFVAGEGPASVLDSLTVTGGRASRGGGILVRGASPTLVRLVVADNQAVASGSGIHLERSRARLYNNLIVRNGTAGGDPHSLQIDDSSPLVVNNTIAHGDSNGVLTRGDSHAMLFNNILAFNGSQPPGEGPRGRGICDFAPTTVMQWNLFFRNLRAAVFGRDGVDHATVRAAQRALGERRVSRNRDGDPRFLDAETGDYRLGARSRALHAGNPDPLFENLDGSRNTIGHLGGPYAAPSTRLP